AITSFSEIAANSGARMATWRDGEVSQRIFVELTTTNYFSTLGLQPSLGRFFSPNEGLAPVAVMNHATWETRFGHAPDILGPVVRIYNVDVTVVGIAPLHFIGINGIFGPDLWIPAGVGEQLFPNEMRNLTNDRGKAVFQGFGRLKPGVDRAQAQANATTV